MTTKVQRQKFQKFYNQVQPAITAAGLVLALFWLMPTTETHTTNQVVQAEVQK